MVAAVLISCVDVLVSLQYSYECCGSALCNTVLSFSFTSCCVMQLDGCRMVHWAWCWEKLVMCAQLPLWEGAETMRGDDAS